MANKKFYRKRRARRRGRRYKKKTINLVRKELLPSRFFSKLRYVDTFTLDPIAIGIADVVYRINDLYDPYYAIGGHQPLGFDQMMALYKRFHVVGAKVTAKFASADETSARSTIITGLMISSDPTLLTNVSTVIEQPGTVWSYAQLGSDIKRLVNKYSVKKQQGITNLMDNHELSGSDSASPSPSFTDYLHVFAATPPGIADSAPVTVCVQIDYLAVFSDPIQLNQS